MFGKFAGLPPTKPGRFCEFTETRTLLCRIYVRWTAPLNLRQRHDKHDATVAQVNHKSEGMVTMIQYMDA
jgi:hypothetical protein